MSRFNANPWIEKTKTYNELSSTRQLFVLQKIVVNTIGHNIEDILTNGFKSWEASEKSQKLRSFVKKIVIEIYNLLDK
jgi:hypothetical protein